MKKSSLHITFFSFVITMMMAILSGCGEDKKEIPPVLPGDPVAFDLDSIRKRGKIILLTENSASTYYLYRNQLRGFDYEMVKAFARHLGVKLEVIAMDDVDLMFEKLNKGEGDLIASNLTVTDSRTKLVSFSTPVYQTRQVIAQRKIYYENDSTGILIRDSSELGRMPIWVHKYSSFYERLSQLSHTLQLPIQIEEAPGEISTDDLIRLVEEGEIPATVTDENLANMEMMEFENVDISVPITGNQDIAWAVRKNSYQLLDALNKWLSEKRTTDKLASTYKKYFEVEITDRYSSKFVMPTLGAGAISPFDSLFKMHAPQIGWDWRMLAALAYQESRFNPQAQSWSGAYGLMQLMPETAVRFGCDTAPDAECSIRASVKYLKYLQGLWKKRVPNQQERDKFVLASYNIGQGHVIDAQNLAKELGMNDTIWDGHVAEALLLKQQEKYYTMPCVKHGYCHAREPYHFVGKIMALFEHYKAGPK
ncbi:MAG: transporter substrate-binding domain-containing protein [Flavobacteriales bacterium]|nr:transporter substrate-binding domain-containing protein [Flavobacteriales bacterium]